jgi:hypothetical protein
MNGPQTWAGARLLLGLILGPGKKDSGEVECSRGTTLNVTAWWLALCEISSLGDMGLCVGSLPICNMASQSSVKICRTS